jgi:hypothetical protein
MLVQSAHLRYDISVSRRVNGLLSSIAVHRASAQPPLEPILDKTWRWNDIELVEKG